MATRIRLARAGSKKRPYYHIVIADVRAPRDGRFIERVGKWNPMLPKDSDAPRVEINEERVKHWLATGAVPTDRVHRFLSDAGIVEAVVRNNPKKALPGKAAQERLAEKAQKEQDAADAKAAAEEEAKEAAAAAAAAEAEAAAAAVEAPAEEEAPADDAIPFVDAVVLLDGVGDKTAEALAAEGVTKLTQISEMSDEDLAALCEKVGAGDQWQSNEWKVQAQEMIDGKPPRAKVDQEAAKKMAAEG